MTVSFSFVAAFRHLRLSCPPSVSDSILAVTKASVSNAEDAILNNVGARTQPHIVRNWKGATVKLWDDRYELAGIAKRLHYLPISASAYFIEGLGQVN